ncbi:signal peptidase I [Blastococcus sp. URHD0036]|uniref:signal peptidase I n=1 Tax=Blastococcus sp. URHD0036 TaxID=1380356 RepID=UPI0018CC7B7C|nr:signal peptidase I [Blastococcus sp. URHD0036]
MTAVLPAPRTAQAPSAGGPATGRPARRRRRPVRAILRFTGRWSLRMLVCTAVLSFLGLAVGPHVLDYRTMTMLTGSMAPSIEPGDVVVSTPLSVSDVEVGMVITYHIPIDDHRVVTHRVIEVDRTADGTVSVRTQGDANDAPDPWTAVLTGDTAYQVQAVVPEIGNVITALRNDTLSTLFVQLLPVALGVCMLVSIWRPGREDDDTTTAGGAR